MRIISELEQCPAEKVSIDMPFDRVIRIDLPIMSFTDIHVAGLVSGTNCGVGYATARCDRRTHPICQDSNHDWSG